MAIQGVSEATPLWMQEVLNSYTKYSHFIPLKHPFTAQVVAKEILDNVLKLHACPKSIVSDRDRIFTSVFWKEHFALFDTNLLRSSAYHPQTDGQSERVNQCLEMYLRCAVYDSPKKWKSWLSLAELWYNTSYHTALGCTPFKALHGYDTNSSISLSGLDSSTSEAALTVQDRAA
jgi:hypothetical protein